MSEAPTTVFFLAVFGTCGQYCSAGILQIPGGHTRSGSAAGRFTFRFDARPPFLDRFHGLDCLWSAVAWYRFLYFGSSYSHYRPLFLRHYVDPKKSKAVPGYRTPKKSKAVPGYRTPKLRDRRHEDCSNLCTAGTGDPAQTWCRTILPCEPNTLVGDSFRRSHGLTPTARRSACKSRVRRMFANSVI